MAKVKYTKTQKAKLRRRRSRQIKGALFLILACIGAFSIVHFIVGKVRTSSNDDEEKLELARIIAPLVALDPVPFESVDKAKAEVLEEASIWAVIYNEDTSKYARNENDQLLIPAVDVDRYFKRIFGSGTLPDHQTFSDGDLVFEFDAEADSYILPITSLSGSYYPRITGIDTSGSTKVLTVEYVTSSAESVISVPGEDDGYKVVKTMEYVLLKEGSDYHIYSIRYARGN